MSASGLSRPGKVCFDSSADAVRQSITTVVDALQTANLGQNNLSSVEIVLAEVLNNVAEHAYPETGPAGPVEINYTIESDGVHFHISDQGHPMPDGKLPVGKEQDLDVDLMDLPEGGFGWFMIHTLARDIVYERVGPQNFLTFRIATGV